jgi:hypothetical protein
VSPGTSGARTATARPWNPVETPVTRRLRIVSMALAVTAVAVLTFPAFRDDAPAALTAAGSVLLCLSVVVRVCRWRIHRRNQRARWRRSAAPEPTP